MKKEIIFSSKFDTAEFDRSIDQLQRKLKEIYAPADMVRMQTQTAGRAQGMGFGMSPASSEAFSRATQQSRREFDQMIAEQIKGQEKLSKAIVNRGELLKKLRDQQKDMVKDSREELVLKEKIARVEENNFRLRENYTQRNTILNEMMDARERAKPQGLDRLMQAYRGGGVGGAMSAAGRMFSQNPVGIAGSIASGLGTALTGGAELYRQFSAMPILTQQAMGSATQGTFGRDVNNIYGRRSAFEQFFAPERANAAQMAIERMQASRLSDKLSLGGSALGIGGGAAAALTGVGVIPGAISAGAGIFNLLRNPRLGALALSPFSNTASNYYQSGLAQQMSADYQGTLEAQRQQNPFKTMAGQEYETNFMRNLQAQRTLGLGNKEFYGQGGFLQRGIGAGFTPEMQLEMSQQILGAGGSTRAARDSAFGLQLQRGANLTNAGQVLGTLSGGMGGAEATRQATIKILAEGMKQGLDDSKFAEENRRFTQAAAEIVARSAAASGADVDRVTAGFGRFAVDNTMKGIEAARSAYEQYQDISKSTTGPRGVMRAAGLMADKDLNKLSTITKQALLQVPEEELNEMNPLVQAAARESGLPAADVIQKMVGINQGSVSRFAEADTIRDRLRSRLKQMGKDKLTEADIKTLPQDMQADFQRLAAFQTTDLGYTNQRDLVARALGTVNQGIGQTGTQAGRERAVEAKLTGETGRMEDTTVRAMAADSKVVLDNFNEMAPAMEKAAKSAAAWTREVKEMNAAILQALEDVRTGKDTRSLSSLQDLLTRISKQGNQNQTQAGKPSN